MTRTTARPRTTVHLAVYDTLADWEYGPAVAHLRSGDAFRPGRTGFGIVTVGLGGARPVTTMGGLRITPDLALDALDPEDSALLVLPGAGLWDAGETLAPFARKARAFLDADVPVAAICGATAGLAREGLLDSRTHTSGAPDYLAAQDGYRGGAHYRDADAVRDRGLITAGPTEPVAFAREILAELDVMEPHVLDAWFRLFRHSDASAFPVLMAAGQTAEEQATGSQAAEGRAAEGQATVSQATGDRAAEGRATVSQATGDRAAEGQATDSQATEGAA